MAAERELVIRVRYNDEDSKRWHREERARIDETAAAQATAAAETERQARAGARETTRQRTRAATDAARETAAAEVAAARTAAEQITAIQIAAGQQAANTQLALIQRTTAAQIAAANQVAQAQIAASQRVAQAQLTAAAQAQRALPGPAAPGALVRTMPDGTQVLAAGGGTGGGLGIPINPTPIPGQPGEPGAGVPPRAVLAGSAMALGAFKTGVETAAQSQAEASAHAAALMPGMEATRASQREIAAYAGQAPTAAFAANLAREGANAGISPQQYQAFKQSFLAFSGQFVGNKLPRDQAERLQQAVAGYAVGAKGLAPEESARLLGTVVDKMPPGATDEDILNAYGKSMIAMQLAPGRTSPLLSQLSEVAGESVGPGNQLDNLSDAALLLRQVAQRNPNQASAYTRGLLRGFRRMSDATKKELGITDRMNVFERIEKLGAAQEAAVARGEDAGKFVETHGFRDIRQYGGAMIAIESGVRGGGFSRTREEMAAVNAGTVRGDTAAYLAGEEGSAQREQAQIEAARLGRAANYTALQKARRKAEVSLESTGELERGEGFGAILTQAGRLWGAGDRREQEIRAETARILDQRIRDFRGFAGARPMIKEFMESETPGMFFGSTMKAELANRRYVSDENLAKAANFLEKLTRIAEQREAERRKAAPTPPARAATVRMPAPSGRMGESPAHPDYSMMSPF